MAKTITITLKVVTPLFTGSVMQGKTPVPELRAQTIKGLLRFWYRALHPPPAQGNPGPWREEFRIFGSTSEQGGQSVFRLSVESPPELFKASGDQKWPVALAYLGYGPISAIQGETNCVKVNRPWIPEGTEIKLKLRFGPRTMDGDIEAVMQALWALCTFGGIGARSRHGWGSVQLTDVDDAGYTDLVQEFETREAMCMQIRRNLQRFAKPASDPPEYTAFSNKMQLLLSPAISGTWKDVLKVAGERMQQWRKKRNLSHGDHQLVMEYLEGKYVDQPLPQYPEGVAFGLPHNFYLKKPKPPSTANIDATGKGNRRASPLLLSVKRIGSDKHVALHSFLPATFLPRGARVRLSPPRDNYKDNWDDKRLESISKTFNQNHSPYRVIEDYLTELHRYSESPPSWAHFRVFENPPQRTS